jgi:hypothetical protein
LPHPAQAVLQRPEVHELPILRPYEEHLINLHAPARGRLAEELAQVGPPEQRKRPATVCPSETNSTTSSCQSGKAARNSAKSRLIRRAAL